MYDDYIKINKKFKASVNLEFDLGNEEKIEQYIPTTDLCDVIKRYLKAVTGNANFKATTLSGPYGKGKSYLLLMIIYFLSKHENRDLFVKVCNKIRIIDEELYKLVIEFDSKGNYLIPIIINNSSYSDINKVFLSAISSSLKIYGFDNVVPNSSYAEALGIIKRWEKELENGFDIMNICLQKLNINLEDLKIGLKNYSTKAFNDFSDLYSCVSHGLVFYSLRSDDIVSIYSDINEKVTRLDYKCKGLFIVFDEFGSFLNNQSSDFVTRLAKIQALAEKCNMSDEDAQMHFCCITHKDILLYKKDKAYNDAFDTIAGRFDSIRFDRSLDENYQIICSALVKSKEYNNLISEYKIKYSYLFDYIQNTGIFTKEQLEYIICNGCPINPITMYMLIQVSEKIGQNERTLFTFLSDADTDGFRYFISNNNLDYGILNVDSIYNYFESEIKDNDEYKMLYYKVESLKKFYIKEDIRKIFKVIAIFKIINDTLKLNCTIDNIAMALGLKVEECNNNINLLIESKALKKNINDESIDFAICADKEINKLISDTAEIRFSNIELSKYLSIYDYNRYEISNEYNFNHKMVRYYKCIYLEASKFVQLSSLDELIQEEFKKEYFDGLIINLINDNKITQSQVKEILNRNPINIIVRYVSENIGKQLLKKVKELSAAKLLCEDKKSLSDSAIKTLPLLVEDMTDEISTYLYDVYSKARPLNKIDYHEKSLAKLINLSFENYYPNTVLLNNEQVNRNSVQSVTAKARNNVIDCILKQKEVSFGKTSQEMTIYTSFINGLNDNILKVIKDFFINHNDEKINFKHMIDFLKSSPYGMREGIIPLYVAKAIADLSLISENKVETIILYMDKVEIELDASNLSKACLNPDAFFYCYTQVNMAKINMTYNLMKLFNCERKSTFIENIRELNLKIKTYISNLSPIIVKSSKKDNPLNLSDYSLSLKDLFIRINSNNYELLYNELPTVLGTNFENINLIISNILDEYQSKTLALYIDIIGKTKHCFGISEGSLKAGIDEWINKYSYINNIVFETNHKKIYKALMNLSFNDNTAINSIAFGCVNCGLDDFNTKKIEEYFGALNSFVKKIIEYNADDSIKKQEFIDNVDENITLSNIGNTLYSNIVEAVEEYGDAVSNEEKVLIYKKLLKELLG